MTAVCLADLNEFAKAEDLTHILHGIECLGDGDGHKAPGCCVNFGPSETPDHL
jgi:hypothetical protein